MEIKLKEELFQYNVHNKFANHNIVIIVQEDLFLKVSMRNKCWKSFF